jgi:hypothetical protein
VIENLFKLAKRKQLLVPRNLGLFPGFDCAEVVFQRPECIPEGQANDLVACGAAGHAYVCRDVLSFGVWRASEDGK